MSRDRCRPPSHRRPAPPAREVEVLVCRGSCCGSAARHPHVDHEAHLRTLRHGARSAPVPTTVRTVDCLAACALSNVVVVRTGSCRRDHSHWFGLVLDDDVIEALARWLTGGASGPAPDVVRRHAMPMPQQRPVG